MDVVGLEAVAQGFFSDASSPSPLLLDQDALGVEVHVSEEEKEMQVSEEEVESLLTQEEKLISWRMCFGRLPDTPSLMPEQDDPNADMSWM